MSVLGLAAQAAAAQIVLAAATTTPEPNRLPDPDSVTPGTLGFIITAAVVIISIFLINDAVRRVRRVRAHDGAIDISPLPIRPDGAPSDWTPDEQPEADPDQGDDRTQ